MTGTDVAAEVAGVATKRCPRCRETKPIADFPRRKTGRPYAYCRPCARELTRAAQTTYRTTHSAEVKKSKLKHRYGITPEDVDSMVEQQQGKCPICDREMELVIDHDHETGKVRSLLCRPCNVMLGGAEDDPDRLLSAAAYLIQHRDAESSVPILRS